MVDRVHSRRGFTLVELMVVIFIIALLMGLLIPVVSRVRISGQVADTKNWISQISSAIERYHSDFRAYPGPLSDVQVYTTPATPSFAPFAGSINFSTASGNGFDVAFGSDRGKITMSENLVLGLLGGLKVTGTAPTFTLVYDPVLVGQGPSSLNPNNPKRFPPYMDPTNLSFRDESPGETAPGQKTGKYADDTGPANDTQIPEFLDRFSQAMPILYLRCRLGVDPKLPVNDGDNSVITMTSGAGTRNGPYDLSQILAYTAPFDSSGAMYSATALPVPATYHSIGEGKSFNAYFDDTGKAISAPVKYHGLWRVDALKASKEVPYPAYKYFESPSTPNVPRQKDGYILISAGKDRTYGTSDDICSFGDVNP